MLEHHDAKVFKPPSCKRETGTEKDAAHELVENSFKCHGSPLNVEGVRARQENFNVVFQVHKIFVAQLVDFLGLVFLQE